MPPTSLLPTPPSHSTITASYITLPPTPSWTLSYPYPPLILVLSNVFTSAECANFLSQATTSTNNTWDAAGVNTGLDGAQRIYREARDCGRIIYHSEELAKTFVDRVRPWLEEVEVLGGEVAARELRGEEIEESSELKSGKDVDWVGIIGSKGLKGQKWKMTRFDPSLRFLRYGPGNYFRHHCDENKFHPSTGETSFITLHAYLNDVPSGGSTRIFAESPDTNPGTEYIDIEAKMGSVLLFQQRGLRHSGEEVKVGCKYSVRTDLLYERVV